MEARGTLSVILLFLLGALTFVSFYGIRIIRGRPINKGKNFMQIYKK